MYGKHGKGLSLGSAAIVMVKANKFGQILIFAKAYRVQREAPFKGIFGVAGTHWLELDAEYHPRLLQ